MAPQVFSSSSSTRFSIRSPHKMLLRAVFLLVFSGVEHEGSINGDKGFLTCVMMLLGWPTEFLNARWHGASSSASRPPE